MVTKHFFWTICFLHLSFFCRSQDTLKTGDFNADGQTERLMSRCDRGSGFGGCNYYFTGNASCPNDTLTISRCFCSLLAAGVYPAGWLAEKNNGFVAAFEEYFFKSKPLRAADPSLLWLLNVYFSYRPEPNDSLFISHFNWMPQWQAGGPELSGNYCIRLQDDSLQKMQMYLSQEYKASLGRKKGILVYYAQEQISQRENNFRKISLKENGVSAYATGSSLVYEMNGKHTWCFVNNALFEGPPKHGANTIKHALIFDGLLFIHVQSGGGIPDQLFVIDPVAGKGALLNNDPFPSGLSKMEIKKGKLSFTGHNGKLIVLSLKKIKARL